MSILYSLILFAIVPNCLAQRPIQSHYPDLSLLASNGTFLTSGNAGEAGHYAYNTNGTLLFINRTLSNLPSGHCFTEVLTASLVTNTSNVPAGNGSRSSLSKIQVCCDGYERNPHVFSKCDPVCKQECVNGLCIAPNVCRCFPDHVLNLGGFCIPTCPIGCGNGECQPDRKCACKPGYALEPMRKFCVPKCIPGCMNGNCTAPNVCECNAGYERSPEGVCVAKCSNCENGRCMSPGICTCKPGYIRQGDKCLPVCPKGCQSGYCIAPNVCSCERGYILDKSGTACAPHCEKPCLNGICGGPNKCRCNTGYVADEVNPWMCKPFCPNGCPNGVCSGPNFCICNAGFVKDRSAKGRQDCIPSN